MPAQLPAPKTIKVAVSGSWNGINWANIFHVQYTGPAPASTDLNTLATAAANAWDTQFGGILVNSMRRELVVCTDLDTNTGAQGADSTVVPGALAVATGPNQVAPVLNWHEAVRYRGGHPKTFLPGIPDSVIINGLTLQPAFQANVDLAAAGFQNALRALPFGANTTVGLVVVHYHRGHAVLNPPVIGLLTAHSVRSLVGSMRGRRK